MDFIFGCIATLLVVLTLLWCCSGEKKVEKLEAPIDPDELYQQIMSNLVAVQMLEFRLQLKSKLPYGLLKQMTQVEQAHGVRFITVSTSQFEDHVEDAADKAMEDQAWERLKIALNLAWTDDDDMSKNYAD